MSQGWYPGQYDFGCEDYGALEQNTHGPEIPDYFWDPTVESSALNVGDPYGGFVPNALPEAYNFTGSTDYSYVNSATPAGSFSSSGGKRQRSFSFQEGSASKKQCAPCNDDDHDHDHDWAPSSPSSAAPQTEAEDEPEDELDAKTESEAEDEPQSERETSVGSAEDPIVIPGTPESSLDSPDAASSAKEEPTTVPNAPKAEKPLGIFGAAARAIGTRIWRVEHSATRPQNIKREFKIKHKPRVALASMLTEQDDERHSLKSLTGPWDCKFRRCNYTWRVRECYDDHLWRSHKIKDDLECGMCRKRHKHVHLRRGCENEHPLIEKCLDPNCGAGFAERFQLLDHMKQYHPKDAVPPEVKVIGKNWFPPEYIACLPPARDPLARENNPNFNKDKKPAATKTKELTKAEFKELFGDELEDEDLSGDKLLAQEKQEADA